MVAAATLARSIRDCEHRVRTFVSPTYPNRRYVAPRGVARTRTRFEKSCARSARRTQAILPGRSCPWAIRRRRDCVKRAIDRRTPPRRRSRPHPGHGKAGCVALGSRGRQAQELRGPMTAASCCASAQHDRTLLSGARSGQEQHVEERARAVAHEGEGEALQPAACRGRAKRISVRDAATLAIPVRASERAVVERSGEALELAERHAAREPRESFGAAVVAQEMVVALPQSPEEIALRGFQPVLEGPHGVSGHARQPDEPSKAGRNVEPCRRSLLSASAERRGTGRFGARQEAGRRASVARPRAPLQDMPVERRRRVFCLRIR